MTLVDLDEVLGEFVGVRRVERSGQLPEWRYHGRLVARQLDDEHVVLRIDFEFRRSLLQIDTSTFSVPKQYETHMMVVANFVNGDAGAIVDALENAWLLQRSAD